MRHVQRSAAADPTLVLRPDAARGRLEFAIFEEWNREPPGRNCRSPEAALCRVHVLATVLLVAAGGLVTSHDAGLAVPDWPNTYGSNMFLYPLGPRAGGWCPARRKR